MIDKRFNGAIKIVFERLERAKLKWAIVGSTNMALQGIDVKPNDLDVVLQLKDLKRAGELFTDYDVSDVTELPAMTSEPAWEVGVTINGVEVHFLGELDTGEYVRKLLGKNLIHVKLDNLQIPCFSLEIEAQAYEETKRENKAKLIKEFLKKKNKN